MSGAEVLGIISAVISIVDATVKVYNAAKDEAGLPPNFKTVSTKLPLVLQLLKDAKRYINHKADNAFAETLTLVLEDCEKKATQLQDLFEKVVSTEGDSRIERYFKAARTIGKGGRVETLMKGILDDLQLLTTKFPDDTLSTSQESLTDAIREVNKLDSSLPDGFENAPPFAHYGSGAQNVNTGLGSQYINNSTGNQNNGPGIQYIGTNHIGPSTHHHAAPERLETPPNPSNFVPFSPDSDFVARGDILKEIEQSCDRPESRTALVGFGGVGERFPDTWVFWIHGSNRARFEQGFRDIATHIKLPGRRSPNVNIFELVHDWLRDIGKGRWVIILDNVDDASYLKSPSPNVELSAATNSAHTRQLRSYIPYCQHGSVLVTSRSKAAVLDLVDDADIIPIMPMNEQDALQLFKKKLRQSDVEACARELAEALEYMPLAIVQAAAYVMHRRPRYSLRKYLDEFRSSDRRKVNLLSVEGGGFRRDTEANNSIILTWQMSFEYIRENRPSAAELLSLMSFCDRQGIPEVLLRSATDDLSGNSKQNEPDSYHNIGAGEGNNDDAAEIESKDSGNDSDRDSTEQQSNYSDNDNFESDILTLRNFSFITVNEDGATFEMHRLVQLATLEWLRGHDLYDQRQHQFLEKLCAEFPDEDYAGLTKCHLLLPHIQLVSTMRPAAKEPMKKWATILYRAARHAYTTGRGVKAENFSILAMKAIKRLYGEEHEAVLKSKELVAVTYTLRGRWSEAERLQVEVVENCKTKLGEGHFNTLISICYLSRIYSKQGRREEAEKLLVQVKQSIKTELSEDHPDTLLIMDNLASVFIEQGLLEAKRLLVQVIESRKTKPGEDPPNAWIAMSELALVYIHQGQWEEAERLLVQALASSKIKLGEDHPDMVFLLSNLAAIYSEQGRWEEAERLQVQVMETRKAKLREGHLDTLTSMSNLAWTYSNQGRCEEAERLQLQVMETRKAKLGEDHTDTLKSMSNLAWTYSNQGRWEEAERLQLQVMETRKAKLGEDHPDTLNSMSYLAWIQWKMERFEGARALLRHCVQLQRDKLGASHPHYLSNSKTLIEWES